MELTSSHQRRVVAAAIGAASVIISWFAGEPSGLLVAVAVDSICVGWDAGVAAGARPSLLAAFISRSPISGAGGGLVQLAAFVAGALGLWLLVKIFRTISFHDRLFQGAGPSITDIPGLGWFAYPDGRLRFLNPAALEYVGVTPDEMREIMDADDFSWWRRFVHPDDVEP